MIGRIVEKTVESGYEAVRTCNNDLTMFKGDVAVQNGGGFGDRIVITGLSAINSSISPADATWLAGAVLECALYIELKKANAA